MVKLRKYHVGCMACGKQPARQTYKYCSLKCQQEYQFRIFIKRWKIGEVDGLNGQGMVSPQVKRYLRLKYHNQCSICGWNKINPVTKKVPLIADHINGNWKDNKEKNLRLICPNCDSLTFNYKGNKRKSVPM